MTASAGLDPDAPVFASARVEVRAALDVVWATLVDAGRWSDWYRDIRKVSASGPLTLGSGFSFKTGPVLVHAEVDRCEPGALLRFTGTAKGSSSTYQFVLQPAGETTVVAAAQTMTGPAARAMRPMMQKIAETSLPAWLGALGRECEGASS